MVGYVRVSGHKQKKDLDNQINGISQYAEDQGWKVGKIYRDIASGLNDERPGFLRMLRDLPVSQPYAVLTTYKDRLTRFGTKVVETFCNIFSSRLISIHLPKNQSDESQMVDDVIALVTSFAGKIHRKRRGRVT